MEALLTIAALVLPLSGFYFWGRGIVRASKSDVVVGFSLVALAFIVALVISGSSALFLGVGVLGLVFGVETLIVSRFAGPDCPINRKERIALGVGALVGGALCARVV